MLSSHQPAEAVSSLHQSAGAMPTQGMLSSHQTTELMSSSQQPTESMSSSWQPSKSMLSLQQSAQAMLSLQHPTEAMSSSRQSAKPMLSFPHSTETMFSSQKSTKPMLIFQHPNETMSSSQQSAKPMLNFQHPKDSMSSSQQVAQTITTQLPSQALLPLQQQSEQLNLSFKSNDKQDNLLLAKSKNYDDSEEHSLNSELPNVNNQIIEGIDVICDEVEENIEDKTYILLQTETGEINTIYVINRIEYVKIYIMHLMIKGSVPLSRAWPKVNY